MNNNCSTVLVLPVKEPIITSYTHYAIAFSILPNYENTQHWINSHYLNLWGVQLLDGSVPLRFSSWEINKACPFFSYNTLSFDLVYSLSDNVTEFILASLSNGYYLYLPADDYYVSVTEAYQKKHFWHYMFVYGYDKQEKVFYVGDFFRDGKFSFEKVSFEEMEEATHSVYNMSAPDYYWHADGWNDIHLFRYIDLKYEFNMNIFTKSISDFLNSRDTLAIYEDNIVNDEEKGMILEGKFVFGMENYNLIKRYLQSIKGNRQAFLDIRPLHTLYDYEVLMLSRLDYLKEKGYINHYESLYRKFENLKNLCLSCRNMLVKYSITSQENLIGKMEASIDTIAAEKKAALTELLSDITQGRQHV